MARSLSALEAAMITPLPAARPSALITTGKPRRVGKGLGGGRVAKAAIGGGGNADFGAEVLDEAFGAFQHRGRLGRAQGADAGGFERVPQTRRPAGRRPRSRRNRFAWTWRIPPGRENPSREWPRIPPPRRCRHCRARNKAWSAGGWRTKPRPGHVPGRPIPPAECSHVRLAQIRAAKVCIICGPMSETAESPAGRPGQSAGIFRQRIVRRPEADGGGGLSLCPGAGRDFGPEGGGFRPYLFRPQGRQGGPQRHRLEADRAAAESPARAGAGSDLHRPGHHLSRLLALSADRRADGTGGRWAR